MKRAVVHTVKIFGVSVMAVLLSACGGGGSSGSGNEATPNDHVRKIAVLGCDPNKKMEEYTPLQSGDIVEKSKANTRIRLYHIQDGRKFVCVLSGEALVKRR